MDEVDHTKSHKFGYDHKRVKSFINDTQTQTVCSGTDNSMSSLILASYCLKYSIYRVGLSQLIEWKQNIVVGQTVAQQ